MHKERLFLIYKIVNKITGKFYIGKHETYNEFDKYFGSGIALKASIKIYGKDNFYKEIIERCIDAEKLNDREIFWINELNSIVPNGYNIGVGGKGGNNFINSLTRDISINKIRIARIGTKASDKTKILMSITRSGVSIHPTENVECVYCGKILDKRNAKRWHMENCLSNPNRNNFRIWPKKECPFCKNIFNIPNTDHFKYCKLNPDRVVRDYRYKANSKWSYIKGIETKRNNGTLNHSEETKLKIKNSMLKVIENKKNKLKSKI